MDITYEKTDEQLVHMYREGGAPALEALIDRYLDPLYSFSYRIVGNESDASDVVQETFVRAWKKLSTFDAERSFKAWLYTIAKHVAFDALRKKKPVLFSRLDREGDEGSFESTLSDESPLPDALFEQREIRGRLEPALLQLSPSIRSVVMLHVVDELTFEEISAVTGSPMNTVKSQYRRALIRLRTYLKHMHQIQEHARI